MADPEDIDLNEGYKIQDVGDGSGGKHHRPCEFQTPVEDGSAVPLILLKTWEKTLAPTLTP